MNSKRDDGISVKDLEEYAKKNRFPVAIAIGVILACIFSLLLDMTRLSIIVLTIGTLVGVFLPGKIQYLAKKTYAFVGKQEKTTQIVIGVVYLVVSIFFPPLIFVLLGLHSGKDLRHLMMEEAHHEE